MKPYRRLESSRQYFKKLFLDKDNYSPNQRSSFGGTCLGIDNSITELRSIIEDIKQV